MLKKEDLLQFTKSVELVITQIEDDSSDKTEVKILHLANPVTAVGSIPTPEGKDMAVSGNKVYVAAEDIDEFLLNADAKDGAITYKGGMHLDVSKPQGRTNADGEFTITKPAKIWLTKTKFSRSGGALRTEQKNGLNSMINKMFAGKTLDLTAEVAPKATTEAGGTPAATGKEKPEAVATEKKN